MVYTIPERVELVRLFFQNDESYEAAAALFNMAHPDSNVRRNYVRDLILKFNETGSVGNRKHRPERPVRNEATEVAVLGHFEVNKRHSLRQASEELAVPRSTIHSILKSHKYHPYKFKLVHELNEDDGDRRLQFCEDMTQRLNDNPNLLYNICFSDECTFYLNGTVNRHNCRIWSDENPHEFRETHSQYPQKTNVWAGTFGDHVVGPYFLPDNLTGDIYLHLLQNTVDPTLTYLIENYGTFNEEDIHFQQDGAPPHYAATVRHFLDERFPGQWIGRRGPIEWPARSPDFNPLDFFLWGHLKTVCYATPPASVEDLQQRIEAECRRITPEMLQNVRRSFEARLYYCMEVDGKQFEHLLK